MGLVPVGREEQIPGGTLSFDAFALCTGLLVKQNPALPYTFTGFALATAGVMAYLIFNPRRRGPVQNQNGNAPATQI
ncbi:hypothetical protein [Thermodesulfitimonas sp.]